jgi:predicted secreted protein
MGIIYLGCERSAATKETYKSREIRRVGQVTRPFLPPPEPDPT